MEMEFNEDFTSLKHPMEEAGDSWQLARREFFPDPRIPHVIEAERQRALVEIVASLRRPPAPSSTRLSTEAGGSFPAHGLAPDQPSLLLPTPNPVPGPVLEGFVDEPPPHLDPVLGSVSEGFMDEPPPHPDPVPGSVPVGFMDEPPPHPDPVPGSVFRRVSWMNWSEDELPPSLVPVPEEFVEDLSPLPVPVPEGCEDTPSLHVGPRRLRRRSPQPRRRSQLSLHRSPGFQWSPHRASELHRGFSWSRRWPSDHRLLRRRPAQLLRRRTADRRICGDSLLIAGSAGDGHRAGRLNSGSAGDGLRAGRLNS
ncbi:hypothetical protein CRENBAI_012367 [Crenichthys baileyi]|uniref:Uncharacterized protein n=1 Tax=Crenichthys baileyi TaxID=28760 RepID=A0AAV9S786_9TELE